MQTRSKKMKFINPSVLKDSDDSDDVDLSKINDEIKAKDPVIDLNKEHRSFTLTRKKLNDQSPNRATQDNIMVMTKADRTASQMIKQLPKPPGL